MGDKEMDIPEPSNGTVDNSLHLQNLLQECSDFDSTELLALESYIKDINKRRDKSKNGDKIDKKGKKQKAQREFDFTKFKRRHVFLRFLYFGWNYNGYVVQDNTDQTVEEKVYEALLQTRLIESRESSGMNRCGRTDKGVSAFSQVISVTVRSNLKTGSDLLVPDNYSGPESGSDSLSDELDYVQILNGVLPKDIRVYAWAPISPNSRSLSESHSDLSDHPASARFDCKRRSYHYHFDASKYDIKKMDSAAKMLVGEHDFRNLCKMDVRNGVTNYVRTVYSAEITPQGVFTIEASAFLYHQIRCIMTILMMIGAGLEQESIVEELLDIEKNPGKPQYPLAEGLNLVLFDVVYDETLVPEWLHGKNPSTLENVIQKLLEHYQEFSTKASIVGEMAQELRRLQATKNPEYSADSAIPKVEALKHKPLMKRPRCLTLEESLEKANQNAEKKSKI